MAWTDECRQRLAGARAWSRSADSGWISSTSASPPLALRPISRAGITRVRLSTSRSPGRRYEGKSRTCRCSQAPPAQPAVARQNARLLRDHSIGRVLREDFRRRAPGTSIGHGRERLILRRLHGMDPGPIAADQRDRHAVGIDHNRRNLIGQLGARGSVSAARAGAAPIAMALSAAIARSCGNGRTVITRSSKTKQSWPIGWRAPIHLDAAQGRRPTC